MNARKPSSLDPKTKNLEYSKGILPEYKNMKPGERIKKAGKKAMSSWIDAHKFMTTKGYFKKIDTTTLDNYAILQQYISDIDDQIFSYRNNGEMKDMRNAIATQQKNYKCQADFDRQLCLSPAQRDKIPITSSKKEKEASILKALGATQDPSRDFGASD